LDLWLTLIRSNSAFKPARNELFIKSFGIKQSPEDVLSVFHKYDKLFNCINESTGGNLARNEMLYLILDALAKDIRCISPAMLEDFWLQADELFFNYPPELMDSRIVKILSDFQNVGISVSLLSNTAFIIGKTLRKFMGFIGIDHLLDFQVYSDEVNHSKPSPSIYDLVYVEANKIRPISRMEVLHIGDNALSDYTGANNAGFNSILFRPDHESLSALLETILCTQRLHCTI
jgi:putative hydrolase of the HAD superfamily